jgi:hypothetical protein
VRDKQQYLQYENASNNNGSSSEAGGTSPGITTQPPVPTQTLKFQPILTPAKFLQQKNRGIRLKLEPQTLNIEQLLTPADFLQPKKLRTRPETEPEQSQAPGSVHGEEVQ